VKKYRISTHKEIEGGVQWGIMERVISIYAADVFEAIKIAIVILKDGERYQIDEQK
jgi:hypothetical protein